MQIEPLVDDLLRYARTSRELTAENLRVATALLALPRYATCADPPQQLADDLRTVLDALPAHEDHVETRTAARLIFNLECPGLSLTERRSHVHDRHGTADRWLTWAAAYRVVLGLLDLSTDVVPQWGQTGFVVNSLSIELSWRTSVVTARYDLSLFGRGSHLVQLPFKRRFTIIDDSGLPNACRAVHHSALGGGRFSRGAALLLSSDGKDDRRLVSAKARQPLGARFASRDRHSFITVTHSPIYALGVLMLSVTDLPASRLTAPWEGILRTLDYAKSEVLGDLTDQTWEIRQPIPGATYTLRIHADHEHPHAV